MSLTSVETAVQGVFAKIIAFEKLVEQDFANFEAWIASMAPQTDAALQELASLATVAAPLAAANPAVGSAIAAAVTVADSADAVIHAVAANQAANQQLGLVNGAKSIVSIAASINQTHGAIAAAKGSLSTAIAQAVKTATSAPAPVAPAAP
jgi:hypothetical protein